MELQFAGLGHTTRKAGLEKHWEPRFGHDKLVFLLVNQVEIVSRQLAFKSRSEAGIIILEGQWNTVGMSSL